MSGVKKIDLFLVSLLPGQQHTEAEMVWSSPQQCTEKKEWHWEDGEVVRGVGYDRSREIWQNVRSEIWWNTQSLLNKWESWERETWRKLIWKKCSRKIPCQLPMCYSDAVSTWLKSQERCSTVCRLLRNNKQTSWWDLYLWWIFCQALQWQYPKVFFATGSSWSLLFLEAVYQELSVGDLRAFSNLYCGANTTFWSQLTTWSFKLF